MEGREGDDIGMEHLGSSHGGQCPVVARLGLEQRMAVDVDGAFVQRPEFRQSVAVGGGGSRWQAEVCTYLASKERSTRVAATFEIRGRLTRSELHVH